jgi:hypothetical protein
MSRVEPRPTSRPVWPLVAWLAAVPALVVAGIYLAVSKQSPLAIDPVGIWLRTGRASR